MLCKRTVFVSLFMLVLPLLLSACALNSADIGTVKAQEAWAAQETLKTNRTITVVGRGQAFGVPDRAQVALGVDVFDKNVNQATRLNEETIQRIMAALAEQGVLQKDIQTINYGLWAEQIYGDKGPEGIAGYRVMNQVRATIRDIDKVGDVLSAVIEAGANSVNDVAFSVADTESLEAEARSMAIENAQRRASTLAELAGAELGEILVISEVVDQPLYPLPGTGGGASMDAVLPSISPGQFSYEVQVQVTYSMR